LFPPMVKYALKDKSFGQNVKLYKESTTNPRLFRSSALRAIRTANTITVYLNHDTRRRTLRQCPPHELHVMNYHKNAEVIFSYGYDINVMKILNIERDR
jgi:hypothetical protein